MFLYWLYGLCYQFCSMSRKPEHVHVFVRNFLTDEQATGTPPPPLIAAAAGGRGDTLIHLGLISLAFYLLSLFFPLGFIPPLLFGYRTAGPRSLTGSQLGVTQPLRGGIAADTATDLQLYLASRSARVFPPRLKYSPHQTAFVQFSEPTGCDPSSEFHADATKTPVCAAATHTAPRLP